MRKWLVGEADNRMGVRRNFNARVHASDRVETVVEHAVPVALARP